MQLHRLLMFLQLNFQIKSVLSYWFFDIMFELNHDIVFHNKSINRMNAHTIQHPNSKLYSVQRFVNLLEWKFFIMMQLRSM